MHVISAHEIMFLHDVFQHHCKSLCNQQYIFLYQNNANRKTKGGLGGNGRGNSHDFKILEKPGGGTGGPLGTNANIAKILQKAPVSKSDHLSKIHNIFIMKYFLFPSTVVDNSEMRKFPPPFIYIKKQIITASRARAPKRFSNSREACL